MGKEEKKLMRLTIDQLVKIAFAEGVREQAIISEWKGPYSKSIIVHEIMDNRRNQK